MSSPESIPAHVRRLEDFLELLIARAGEDLILHLVYAIVEREDRKEAIDQAVYHAVEKQRRFLAYAIAL